MARSRIVAQLEVVPRVNTLLEDFDRAIEDFIAGRPVQLDGKMPARVHNLILSIANPNNQQYSSEIWNLDPANMLKRVSAPLLILIGKKDIQINWKTEGRIFETIVERRENKKIIYPENANHVLKYEPRARSELNPADAGANYNTESAELDKMSFQIILSWLEDHLWG